MASEIEQPQTKKSKSNPTDDEVKQVSKSGELSLKELQAMSSGERAYYFWDKASVACGGKYCKKGTDKYAEVKKKQEELFQQYTNQWLDSLQPDDVVAMTPDDQFKYFWACACREYNVPSVKRTDELFPKVNDKCKELRQQFDAASK